MVKGSIPLAACIAISSLKGKVVSCKFSLPGHFRLKILKEMLRRAMINFCHLRKHLFMHDLKELNVCYINVLLKNELSQISSVDED